MRPTMARKLDKGIWVITERLIKSKTFIRKGPRSLQVDASRSLSTNPLVNEILVAIVSLEILKVTLTFVSPEDSSVNIEAP